MIQAFYYLSFDDYGLEVNNVYLIHSNYKQEWLKIFYFICKEYRILESLINDYKNNTFSYHVFSCCWFLVLPNPSRDDVFFK